MMFGVVNNNCEAIIKVAVGRIGSPKIAVDAVIDTGFTNVCPSPPPGFEQDGVMLTTINTGYKVVEPLEPRSVPEPTSILSLLALGTLGAGATLNRKLKSSKPSEKETTKVS